MIKIILLSFILTITACSSYKAKVGKRCIDSEQDGQSWSYLWFVEKGVKFNECE